MIQRETSLIRRFWLEHFRTVQLLGHSLTRKKYERSRNHKTVAFFGEQKHFKNEKRQQLIGRAATTDGSYVAPAWATRWSRNRAEANGLLRLSCYVNVCWKGGQVSLRLDGWISKTGSRLSMNWPQRYLTQSFKLIFSIDYILRLSFFSSQKNLRDVSR